MSNQASPKTTTMTKYEKLVFETTKKAMNSAYIPKEALRTKSEKKTEVKPKSK